MRCYRYATHCRLARKEVVGAALTAAVVLAASALPALAASGLQAAADSAARLEAQIDVALQHAGFAWQADARGLRLHTHHVVNILAGSKSMHFQSSFGNPGDGYGAVEYARDLRASGDVASAGWGDTARILAGWLEQALDHAVRAATAADAGNGAEARASLAMAVGLLSGAKGRSGEKAPVAGAIALKEALAAAAAAAPPAAPAAPRGGGYY